MLAARGRQPETTSSAAPRTTKQPRPQRDSGTTKPPSRTRTRPGTVFHGGWDEWGEREALRALAHACQRPSPVEP